jgi:ferrous iron transport protein A
MSGQVLARLGDPASLDAADLAVAPRERLAAIPEADTRATVQLTTLARNATGTVAGVRLASAGSAAGSSADDERMALRLMEIGFVQGAQLRVIAFGQPGDDPIGVRVGGRGGVSTFALRRLEASCVWVWPDAQS